MNTLINDRETNLSKLCSSELGGTYVAPISTTGEQLKYLPRLCGMDKRQDDEMSKYMSALTLKTSTPDKQMMKFIYQDKKMPSVTYSLQNISTVVLSGISFWCATDGRRLLLQKLPNTIPADIFIHPTIYRQIEKLDSVVVGKSTVSYVTRHYTVTPDEIYINENNQNFFNIANVMPKNMVTDTKLTIDVKLFTELCKGIKLYKSTLPKKDDRRDWMGLVITSKEGILYARIDESIRPTAIGTTSKEIPQFGCNYKFIQDLLPITNEMYFTSPEKPLTFGDVLETKFSGLLLPMELKTTKTEA